MRARAQSLAHAQFETFKYLKNVFFFQKKLNFFLLNIFKFYVG